MLFCILYTNSTGTFVTDFIITQKNIDNMKNQLSNITNWIEHTMNNLGKKIFSAADIATITTATATTSTTLTPLKVDPVTESISDPANVGGLPTGLTECGQQSTVPCTLGGKLYKDKKEIGPCSSPDWADNNDANAACYDKGAIYNKNLEMYDKASNTFISSF